VPSDAPVIGISAGRIAVAGRVIDGTQREYADRITEAGGVPILLPVGPTAAGAPVLALVDGLLFTGGGDVEPRRYGAEQAPESGGIDPERDETETSLLDGAQVLGIPVLAVCRGIQILNVARGGTLVQHLPTVTTEPHLVIERRTEPVHAVRIDPESSLRRILGQDAIVTNTLHHQAIDRLGRHLVAVAWSDDGTVEAVEDHEAGVTAVQWHPEQMPDRPEQMRLFAWLVERAADRRRSTQPDARRASALGSPST
jgi:putative glutamine amidotransferase